MRGNRSHCNHLSLHVEYRRRSPGKYLLEAINQFAPFFGGLFSETCDDASAALRDFGKPFL